jgi:hypothetical protein
MLRENIDPQYLRCLVCMRHMYSLARDDAHFPEGGREETLTMKQGTESITNESAFMSDCQRGLICLKD